MLCTTLANRKRYIKRLKTFRTIQTQHSHNRLASKTNQKPYETQSRWQFQSTVSGTYTGSTACNHEQRKWKPHSRVVRWWYSNTHFNSNLDLQVKPIPNFSSVELVQKFQFWNSISFRALVAGTKTAST